jgi:hypothetical protein
MATDLILDAETGKILYAEEANYGWLLRPCDELGRMVPGGTGNSR